MGGFLGGVCQVRLLLYFSEEPAWGIRRGEKGMAAIGKLEGANRARIVVNEKLIVTGDAPTLGDVRDALSGAYGTDYGLRTANYISRFTDMTRQAASYWDRRVLLAGTGPRLRAVAGRAGRGAGRGGQCGGGGVPVR